MSRKSGSGTSHRQMLAEALAKYQSGQLDQAGILCRRILRRMPREPNALHLLGVVQLMNGERDEAADFLRRAAANDASNAEIHSNLGSALRACGRWDEAEESLRRAIDLSPGHAQAHFNLGNLLRERGSYEDAAVSYRRAIELSPTYTSAYNNLGSALEALGRLDEAAKQFEIAASIDSTQTEVQKNLANMLYRSGRLEDSVKHYRMLLAETPDDAEAHNALGVALSELRRHGEATDAFSVALGLDPELVEAHANLGNALCRQHRPEDALERYRRALELDPGCVDTVANYGHALRQANHLDEAVDVYELALANDPTHAEAEFGLALTLLSRGRFSEGWRHYLARESMAQDRKTYHRRPFPQEMAGRRVLVVSDQGLGDELFFLRFLPQLRQRMAWVAYRPDPRLANMLDRAGIAHRIVRDESEVDDINMRVSVGDLPFLLGASEDSPFPPAFRIPVQGDHDRRIKQTLLSLGPPPYIGLTWRAGTTDRKNLLSKEVPVGGFARAAQATEGTLVSVQRRPQTGEVGALADAVGRPVHDLGDLNDDLEAMLALLGQIDEYLCVSNTNLHLRASLGLGGRVLVPSPPEFRWMAIGDTSPWFPQCRVYRQAPDGDWNAALDALKADLSQGSGSR